MRRCLLSDTTGHSHTCPIGDPCGLLTLGFTAGSRARASLSPDPYLQESWLEDASQAQPEGWWSRLRTQPTAMGLEGVRVVEVKMVLPLTLRNNERALKVLELGHIGLFPMPQGSCQPPFLCV